MSGRRAFWQRDFCTHLSEMCTDWMCRVLPLSLIVKFVNPLLLYAPVASCRCRSAAQRAWFTLKLCVLDFHMTLLQHWSAAFISDSNDITSSYFIFLPRTASLRAGLLPFGSPDGASIYLLGRGHILLYLLRRSFHFRYLAFRKKTSERGDEITVTGVVIVRGAIRIDITEVGRVARIRRPLPPVVRRSTCSI